MTINEAHQQLVAGVKSRGMFGGIVTADNYVKTIAECVGPEQCATQFALSGAGLTMPRLLKESAGALTYSNPDMKVVDKASSIPSMRKMLPKGIDLPDHALMVFENIVTTSREDRDLDILETAGAVMDPKSPLLWQHIHTLPLGKTLAITEQTKSILKVITVLLELNTLTADAAKLIEAEVLRISHGFRALEVEERKGVIKGHNDKGEPILGFRVTKFEIMEQSLVSVPSNVDAEIELFSAGKLESDMFKSHAKMLFDARPTVVPGIGGDRLQLKIGDAELDLKLNTTDSQVVDQQSKWFEEFANAEAPFEPDDLRDAGKCGCGDKITVSDMKIQGIHVTTDEFDAVENILVTPKESSQSLAKAFDPTTEHLEASRLEYDWASRFIGCEIKELKVHHSGIPGLWKGSFLSGLDDATKEWDLNDTRNITRDGKEYPPEHENVQLNSEKHASFLVDGLRFWTAADGEKVCVKVKPTWGGGLTLTTYSKSLAGIDAISKAWSWAHENCYLKGEAFSASGDFLTRGSERLDDVMLESENKDAVRRAVKQIKTKGVKMANRGMIFMGPPGTGKTLSGRIMMNECDDDTTFIWVSARDFWNLGSIGGIVASFDMAKAFAPSILFFEDVDNWMRSNSTDLLKTEMDGIDKSSGVLTVLTTNYPEQLPDALIDRPGRFHDVCEFHLPSEKIRRDMLKRWVPDASPAQVSKMAKETDGYSGAHIYELAQFAKTLREDDENKTTIDEALQKALDKIKEQRQLIDHAQLSGSNYKPTRREFAASGMKGLIIGAAASVDDMGDISDAIKQYTVVVEGFTKSGRVLSAKNLKALKDVKDDLEELKGMKLPRSGDALCERCVKKLAKVIEDASGGDQEEEKPKGLMDYEVDEIAVALLSKAGNEKLRSVAKAIETILAVQDSDAKAEEFAKLVSG